MKKSLVILLLGVIMPFMACAQNVSGKNALPKGVVVKKVPVEVLPENVIENVVSSFKGKVVVIDFWATWCGPCMQAMKQIDPIKEKYLSAKKKNVEFVYITGETSPLPNWETAIKNIKGNHYRLTKNQWGGMMKGFGVRGIPAYMIVGRDGKKSYDNFSTCGYPGDEELVAEIEKALK